MVILFYFLVATLIIVEIYQFQIYELWIKLKELSKKEKEVFNKYAKENIGAVSLSCIVMSYYLGLTLVGLFSSQWPFFLTLLLLGFIPKKRKWWRIVDMILSIMLLLAILVCKFHI